MKLLKFTIKYRATSGCMQDNNWLLLEFAMALPFAIGFKTAAVSRLLALTLVMEALTCWPVWVEWPSV